MQRKSTILVVLVAAFAATSCAMLPSANRGPGFFVTSQNPGRGADLSRRTGSGTVERVSNRNPEGEPCSP